MIFKVAVLQMRSVDRAYDNNIKTIIKSMTEAKNNSADILLLPECFITGDDLTIKNDSALTDNDMKPLCDAAKELEIGLVATALTKGKSCPQNSAFVIGKSGKILMKYSKVHTCDFADERALESGTEFRVCSFDGVKLGVMICYDREYPESARILMLKGAEIIFVPNDCVSMRPRIQALSTRAYENMCGVVMANPDGKNAGSSCAFSPICWNDNDECVDNTLLLADAETEGLFYAEFDMDILRSYREREMMGNTFRKVEAYSMLLNKEIQYPFIREGQYKVNYKILLPAAGRYDMKPKTKTKLFKS